MLPPLYLQLQKKKETLIEDLEQVMDKVRFEYNDFIIIAVTFPNFKKIGYRSSIFDNNLMKFINFVIQFSSILYIA